MKKILNDPILGVFIWEHHWWATEKYFEPINKSIKIFLDFDESITKIPEKYQNTYLTFLKLFKKIEPKIIEGMFDYYIEDGRDWGVGEFEHGVFVFSSLDNHISSNLEKPSNIAESYIKNRGGGIGDIAPIIETPKEIIKLIQLETLKIYSDFDNENNIKIMLGYKCTWDSENVGVAIEGNTKLN